MDVQEQHNRIQAAIAETQAQLQAIEDQRAQLADRENALGRQAEHAMAARQAAAAALDGNRQAETQARARAMIARGTPEQAEADTAVQDAATARAAAEEALTNADKAHEQTIAAARKDRDRLHQQDLDLANQAATLQAMLAALHQEHTQAFAALGKQRLLDAALELQKLEQAEAAARAAANETHAKLEQFRASVADRFADWPELAGRVREIARHEQHAALEILQAFDAYLATLQEHVGDAAAVEVFHNGIHLPSLLVDHRLTREAIHALLVARGISAGRDGVAAVQSVRDDVAALRSAILGRKPAQLKR